MSDECAFCGRPTEGAWVELRLYNGLEALRLANESDERMVPECRITRWEPGPAGARA